MSKITDIGVKLVDVNGLNTFKESMFAIIKDNEEVVAAALNDLDERINNLGELANVQAVDTGAVVDDVNVDYATVDYVNGLIGDINSVLDSIINGGGENVNLTDNYLTYISRYVDFTSSYYFVLEHPAASDLVISASYERPKVVNGQFQGNIEVTDEYHIDKGNLTINETISEFREFINVSITPASDDVYRYVYIG